MKPLLRKRAEDSLPHLRCAIAFTRFVAGPCSLYTHLHQVIDAEAGLPLTSIYPARSVNVYFQMQISHKLLLTLLFSIFYCCMVGSIPMNQHSESSDAHIHNDADLPVNFGPVPQSQGQSGNPLYDLQHTLYNVLNHHNDDTHTLATPQYAS